MLKLHNMAFELPKLPYEYDALEPHIDKQTMMLHHDKHHAGYVDNLNKALEGNDELLKMDILELVSSLDNVPEDILIKVRNNAGGHANHTMFWKIMGPNLGGEPGGKLMDAIKADFGDFTSFSEKVNDLGLKRFGSGWIWVVVNNGKLEVMDTPNQDTPLMEGKKAILGIDVWEHAYYLKYQNRRADYLKAWWNVANWPHIEHHFEVAL